MYKKNRQKKSRILFTTVLLLNMFSQTAVPLVANAEDGTSQGNIGQVEVDKTELDNLVAEADKYDVADYTEESFAIYQKALVEAESVLGTKSVTQANVDHVLTDLQTGISQLAEIVEPEVDEDEETVSDTPEVDEEANEEDNEEPEEIEEEAEEAEEVEETEESEDIEESDYTDFSSFNLARQSVDTFDLSLMHMNDTHAQVPNYANMLTAIKGYRTENPDSLLLHAGDVFSGTLYFNQFEGAADQALLNLLGIDAMVFGNHEFDLGGSPNGHQKLAEFVGGSNYPFLGTNIDFSNDDHMSSLEINTSAVENPNNGEIYNSLIKDVNGERVGIFGLTTEDTAAIASPMSITFSNYISAANTAVQELEEAGVNKIIALTHIGYNTSPRVGNDILLAQNVEGIDIIVGGHSHTALSQPELINGSSTAPTVIVQTGGNAESLGTLQVTFDVEGQIVADSVSGSLINVVEKASDPEALEVLAPYQQAVDELQNTPTGATAESDLENPRLGDGDEISVRANETPLGNLVTDAMLYKAREKFPEIIMAVQNGGGIRAPIAAGPITTGEVIGVLPFGNNPVIAELSGQEIKDIFEWGLREAPGESGGFLHVSGAELVYDSKRSPFDRVVGIYIIDEDGQRVEIDLDETYLITTNGFTGQGGDDFETFANAFAAGRVRDIGEIDWQQLQDYMVEEQYLNGVVDPQLENRIVDLRGGSIVLELLERLAALEERLNNLEAENQALADDLAEVKSQLTATEVDLADANDAIAELEARVVELEEEAGTPSEETSDDETPATDPTDEDSNDSDDDTPATNPSDEDPTDSEDETPATDPTDEDSTDSNESTKQAEGKPLPKTGSNIIIPLVSGATLILTGFGVETLRRKKYNK